MEPNLRDWGLGKWEGRKGLEADLRKHLRAERLQPRGRLRSALR